MSDGCISVKESWDCHTTIELEEMHGWGGNRWKVTQYRSYPKKEVLREIQIPTRLLIHAASLLVKRKIKERLDRMWPEELMYQALINLDPR